MALYQLVSSMAVPVSVRDKEFEHSKDESFSGNQNTMFPTKHMRFLKMLDINFDLALEYIAKAYARGRFGVEPLEFHMLQKLYYLCNGD